jgi:hypothetical protein
MSEAAGRLSDALGLVDLEPGRQIHRNGRGWKTSEVQLSLVILGFVRPSFHSPLVFAVAQMDGEWRAAALLVDIEVGPVVIRSKLAGGAVDAWPSPSAWAREGWVTLDGTNFDLALSTLGARTTLRFNGGPPPLARLQYCLGQILAEVARTSRIADLDQWLASTAHLWS